VLGLKVLAYRPVAHFEKPCPYFTAHPRPNTQHLRPESPRPQTCSYPRTLIFENESTACPVVGRPIDIAGRNVVKISIRFTSGSRFWELSERIR